MRAVQLIISWLFWSLFISSGAEAQSLSSVRTQDTETVPFYLPIETDELEQIVWQLGTALRGAGLNNITPVPVKYWNSYQQSIRHGKPGIYLAAPHYSAWVVMRHNFVPLFRIAEPLRYVIAARRSDSHLFEVNDLNNRLVCAQKPLNLDYLMVNRAFRNPLYSADINTVQSVSREMSSRSSKCEGFALSDHQFKKLAAIRPDQFIRLHQSGTTNNYSIVVYPNMEQKTIDQLRSILAYPSIQPLLKPLLLQFAANPKLVSAEHEDYREIDYQALLPYWN